MQYFIKSNDLVIYKGEERTMTFQVVDQVNEALDITNYEVYVRAQRDTEDIPILTGLCTITDAEDGGFVIDIEDTDTLEWEEGVYPLQVKLVSDVATIYTYPTELLVKSPLVGEQSGSHDGWS